MTIYKNGFALCGNRFEKIDVAVENGKFVKPEDASSATVVDASGKYIAPGLIDRHTHGSFGVDFNLASYDDLKKVLDFYASRGVTSVFPTLLSDSVDVTCAQLTLLADAMKDFPIIKGIHLEGPFLNEKYKGAMPPQFLREPSVELFDKFYKASRGALKIITLASELPNACELISHAVSFGVTVSMGHSNATFAEESAGFFAGATVHTHFMNATRFATQHEAGAMGAVLFLDGLCAEQICDGRHLCPDTFALDYKIKGRDGICLITDSIMAAGLPDGNYKLGVNDIVVENGDALLADRSMRAGSTLTAIDGVKNAARFADIDIGDAFYMYTKTPARLQHLENVTGAIENGLSADFIILDNNFNVTETFINGKKVY